MSSRSHRLGAVTENLAAATHRKDTAPGLFVCFEGGDGAGKSTQVRLLTESLEQRGREVVVTRQPGGTPLGAQIRELVLHGDHVSARAEALLFAADKAHHVDQLIKPALAAGQVVITDRYVDSSITYQGAGRELGRRRDHGAAALGRRRAAARPHHRPRRLARGGARAARRRPRPARVRGRRLPRRGPARLPRARVAATPSATSSSTRARRSSGSMPPSSTASTVSWRPVDDRLGRPRRPGAHHRDALSRRRATSRR